MSKVLIGIAGAIVLAGAVLAFVHFTVHHGPSGPASQVGQQSRWVPSARKEGGRVQVVGTFGAWRLFCREMAGGGASAGGYGMPPQHRRCSVSLLMRNLASPKQFLELRFQNDPTDPTNSTAIAMLAYGHSGGGVNSVAPGSPGEQIDFIADQKTQHLSILRCFKGICFTISPLSSSGVDTLLSAHTLVVKLPATKSAKADQVHLPTDGLNAAFTALRRQQPA